MKTKFYLSIIISTLVVYGFILIPKNDENAKPKISSETQECLDCHESVTPGIVADWRTSRHSSISFEQAVQKPELEKRVSSIEVADNLRDVVVGCYECHGLNADKHKDNFEHFGYKINVIVSPNDCSTCHIQEFTEYSHSKKASAENNLRKNPVYHALVNTVDGIKEFKDGKIISSNVSSFTENETCFACHGTVVNVDGVRKINSDLGEIEVPKLTNWPNQGVGRINPDGSSGSCTACHPRHSFSIEIARQPHTCEQCHLEPDVPAYNIYMESKHGNIFESKHEAWKWEEVPWKLGEDFTAPTCAVCHNSLLTNSSGDVIAKRSHDFGSRLWVRIFGLIYSHPQPKDGETYEIKNKDGLPLPTTFSDVPASEYLISADEQKQRKDNMKNLCSSCHGTNWVESYFDKMDNTLKEADKMVAAATQILGSAWEKKLADNSNPFDETIEQMWVQQWLFYANSVRYASAMSGPDYATFKNGWWSLTKNLNDMHTLLQQLEQNK